LAVNIDQALIDSISFEISVSSTILVFLYIEFQLTNFYSQINSSGTLTDISHIRAIIEE